MDKNIRRSFLMRITIFGSGGVGGYFGSRLAQAGEDVTFIARGEHLKAMQKNGLRVESIQGDFTVNPVKTTDDPAQAEADAVLVAVKCWDVPAAAEAMKPMVGRHTFVVPLENGVEAPDQLAAVLGRAHVLGGLCRISAYIATPGVIRHVGLNPSVTFGELDGSSSQRLEQLRQVFARIPFIRAEISTNIRVDMWDKFLFIATMSGLGGVTRQPVGVFRSVPESRALLKATLEETCTLAQARGVALPNDTVQKTLETIDKLPPATTASMVRDILDGRPSELEAQSGAIVRMGRESGVPTPVHTYIYASLLPGELKARVKIT
jgi:2-dehydropantoate 2-reductase